MSTDPVPFDPIAGGLRLRIRLQPGARRETVDGPVTLPDGRMALAARVSAPPQDGKANAALLKLLAKTWRIPKSAITIVAGHGHRQKILLVAGDPADLEPRLRGWLDRQA